MGECSILGDSITVNPRPDSKSLLFVFRRADVVEGPVDFESNTAPYNRDEVKAIKVRKGSRMTLRKEGTEKEVELVPESGQPHHLASLASAAHRRTYCVGLLEFECGTNKLICPCIFGWDCD